MIWNLGLGNALPVDISFDSNRARMAAILGGLWRENGQTLLANPRDRDSYRLTGLFKFQKPEKSDEIVLAWVLNTGSPTISGRLFGS